ncbi:hypothetical protein VPH35_081781 [Triticum aestivum]
MRPSGDPVRGKYHVVIGPSNPPTDRASRPFAPLDPMASTPLPPSLVFFHLPSTSLQIFPQQLPHLQILPQPPSEPLTPSCYFLSPITPPRRLKMEEAQTEAATAQRRSRPPPIHPVVPR